jgi:hypothetical protein
MWTGVVLHIQSDGTSKRGRGLEVEKEAKPAARRVFLWLVKFGHDTAENGRGGEGGEDG